MPSRRHKLPYEIKFNYNHCVESLHVDATIMRSCRTYMFTFPTVDVCRPRWSGSGQPSATPFSSLFSVITISLDCRVKYYEYRWIFLLFIITFSLLVVAHIWRHTYIVVIATAHAEARYSRSRDMHKHPVRQTIRTCACCETVWHEIVFVSCLRVVCIYVPIIV